MGWYRDWSENKHTFRPLLQSSFCDGFGHFRHLDNALGWGSIMLVRRSFEVDKGRRTIGSCLLEVDRRGAEKVCRFPCGGSVRSRVVIDRKCQYTEVVMREWSRSERQR